MKLEDKYIRNKINEDMKLVFQKFLRGEKQSSIHQKQSKEVS